MSQGINREYIFEDNKNKQKYLSFLKEVQGEINIQILSYCMMDNHVHLLIFEKDFNKIINFMHKVNTKYALFYNKKSNRVGYVFRDRYKVQPIYSQRHLILCIDYIHNNPVKAKKCNKMSDYKYSSYNYNIFNNDGLINEKIRNLIYSKKKYITSDDDYVFMEDDEDKDEVLKDIFNRVLKEKSISKTELINHRDILKNLVAKLKNENGISYRKIEKITGISREVLRKL